jgi:hypothetical protein
MTKLRNVGPPAGSILRKLSWRLVSDSRGSARSTEMLLLLGKQRLLQFPTEIRAKMIKKTNSYYTLLPVTHPICASLARRRRCVRSPHRVPFSVLVHPVATALLPATTNSSSVNSEGDQVPITSYRSRKSEISVHKTTENNDGNSTCFVCGLDVHTASR